MMIQQEGAKEALWELMRDLCAAPTVSGVAVDAERLCASFAENFDEVRQDAVGNVILIRRCGREGAPRILVDAHLDEIGLMVSEVCEGGFLRVVPIGGMDPSVLQAADVCVYGKETLRGVICSTPPHLRAGSDGELPSPDELLVDVGRGYSKEALSELTPVGSAVGFAPIYRRLLGDRVLGKSFDDKACAACAVYGIAQTPRERLAGDVYLLLSRYEETSRLGGVTPAVFAIAPDYALVLDVNLGRVPDVPKHETVVLGEGPSLSLSSGTDLTLTKRVGALCQKQEIPFVYIASPASTGTNATSVQLTRGGIPTADVGLPLQSMHTPCEVISLADSLSMASLVSAVICSEELAAEFCEKEVVLK